MAGKNKGEISELLALPLAIRKSKEKVVLANTYIFEKIDEENFKFRNKIFKIFEFEKYCDKVIATTKKDKGEKGVIKNLSAYKDALDYLGIKKGETLKADSSKNFDIKIDDENGHIKSYLGKPPAFLGYSKKTMIFHEIESNKTIQNGQTLKKIISDNGIKIKSSKIINEKFEKTLKKINRDLPDIYIKLDKELASKKTSSEFYKSLTVKEKRAILDFCKACYSGFAPKTCETFEPNNNNHFIIEISKSGKANYSKINDEYFENLFLNDRIFLDAPSKSKVEGSRTINKKDGKLFYTEAPYIRTKEKIIK